MRRRVLLPLLVVLPFAVPAGAQASHCRTFGDGTHSLCIQHISSHGSSVNHLGRCYARRFFAIDGIPIADASADGHFVGVQEIRMLNDQWSDHAKYGPLDVRVTIRHGHELHIHNASRFAVVVHYTKVCSRAVTS
jgi:hypothetical protein